MQVMVSAPDPLVDRGDPAVAEWVVPSWRSAAVFGAKVTVHRAHRYVSDVAANLRRWDKSADRGFPAVVGESRTRLWSDERPNEHRYQLGKVQNLRRAAALLDRVVVPAGDVFSFWRQVGRASRRRGFVAGRMLQQGCLVPATGGGLCQLSNAIYDAALQSGCAIVERHAHSRAVPGSAAAAGRDATVAWNYVDLRFRPPMPLQIEARLTRDELVIRFRGPSGENPSSPQHTEPVSRPASPSRFAIAARSCATCGETSCFRHEHHPAHPPETGCVAFLVDENWPEFQDYVRQAHRPEDVLGLPLDGRKWRAPRYAWPVDGFSHTGTASLQALARTVAIRRAPAQGAARRHAELTGARRVAQRLARLLTPDVTRVCVAQSLLPYLWRDGHLGGRAVDVMMTRLPMADLQTRLDQAFAAHPDRATLGDFRAPPDLVAAEAEALTYASRIVTPHRDVARLFAEKAAILDWRLPAARPAVPALSSHRIAFAGPTIARKGAHAVRDAAKALGLSIVALGSELEGPGFWGNVAVHKPGPGGDWLDGVAAVVQPAIVEERPSALLMALAAGVPVIASPACGFVAQDGVTTVPPDDADMLIAALKTVLN